jgi:phage terminase small subunit
VPKIPTNPPPPPKTQKRKKPIPKKQRRLFANLLAEGLPVCEAAPQAGYSQSVTKSRAYEIAQELSESGEIEEIRQRNQRIAEKLGFPAAVRIAKFIALTDAKKVVTASDKGIITDEKVYEDGTLQLAAAKELSKLTGDYPDDRLQVEHSGGVKLMTDLDPLASAFDITPV